MIKAIKSVELTDEHIILEFELTDGHFARCKVPRELFEELAKKTLEKIPPLT